MNGFAAEKCANRLVGKGWRRVELGLVMLAALAGSAWTQGPAAPAGPPPAGAMVSSGLPHAMGDDTVAQAVQRIMVATKAMNSKMPPVTPLHLRYELKMVDYKGKEHSGT